MKIENIQINDYKIFNDFNISFLDNTDKPLDLVVLAGINGSGKTTLFEYLFESEHYMSYGEPITKNIIDIKDTKIHIENKLGKIKFVDEDSVIIDDYLKATESNKGDRLKKNILYCEAVSKETKSFYGHGWKYNTKKPLKKEILKYLDKLIFEDGLSAKEAYHKVRVKINNIFDGLDMQVEFSGLDKDKNIYFQNSLGDKINIDQLSTGEKELLNNIFFLYIADIKDNIILIDEPEISLHPSWQNRIVKIYKEFAKTNNNQIIIATHSPQIIASTPNESLRVLVKENGKIKATSLNAYGMDVNKALVDIMGVKELRDIELQTKYNKVKSMILSNDYTSNTFKKEFNELEKMMSNDPIDFGLLKLELLKREKNAKS